MSRKPSIGISLPNVLALRDENYEKYFIWIEAAGGSPMPLIPEFQINMEELDGVLITGGGDIDPSRYGEENIKAVDISADRDVFEIYLIRQAFKLNIPLLGICRGMQVINVSLGGTLHQHLPEVTQLMHSNGKNDVSHIVKIQKDTLLHRIVNSEELTVLSHHHQAPNRLGENLVVSAFAEDGIIEAIEYPGYKFFLGILWHPERMDDESSLKIAQAFVESAANREG